MTVRVAEVKRARADFARARMPIAAAAHVRVVGARTEVAVPSARPFTLRRRLSLAVKRVLDIAGASAALIGLSPIMGLTWLVVVSTSPGPALFWSARVGRHGRLFQMPKFRTLRKGMTVRPREAIEITGQDFTPVGKFLRRSGLDELPQLYCVLVGDMSLIGPRPLLATDPGARERSKYPEALMVRPGISGLAQVNGRNAVSPRRKARLDALYARTVSLRRDLVLMVKTVEVIVNGKGFR